jgi:hypothetical protein
MNVFAIGARELARARGVGGLRWRWVAFDQQEQLAGAAPPATASVSQAPGLWGSRALGLPGDGCKHGAT